ncbi:MULTISPECIES: hypothetical protein [Nitrosopumilus]|uniref:hypothetical protein n=1 Tax=Nitrosopumilus TaxID=338191 RepID=UPI000AFF1E32|nr:MULTISPECIES: hypothetical protein [Nitrosopumilus]
MELVSAEAIIAIISVGAIIVTLFLNIKAQNSVSRGQFATLLNSLSQEHSKLLEQEDNLKSIESCFNYSFAYIDLLNRIAYLCSDRKIPSEIGNYFERFFEYVQLMMIWYDDTVSWDQKTPAKKRWNYIVEWCEGRIPADGDRGDLPKIMHKIWDQYEELNLKATFPRFFEIKKIEFGDRTKEEQNEFEKLQIKIREKEREIDKINGV